MACEKDDAARGSGKEAEDDDDDGSEDSWNDVEDDEDVVFEGLDDRPMQVDDKLYIGSMFAEHRLDSLEAAGITHVLQVAEGLSPSHGDKLSYRTVHVADLPGEDLVAHFKKCFDFIAEAHGKGGGVLVHCVAGVSRSATVCIGWLMWHHRLSFDDAFRRVHRARPWVMPNPGFRKQLERFAEIDCDLSKWTAWRHTWKEEPLTLGLMAIRRQQAGGAGAGGAGGSGGGVASLSSSPGTSPGPGGVGRPAPLGIEF